MLDEIDFTIDTIQHIIERMPDRCWQTDQTVDASSYIIGLSLDGHAEYVINGVPYSVQKGGLVFLPPGTSRMAYSDPGQPWHFISLGCTIRFANVYSRQILENLPPFCSQISDTFLYKCTELSHIWTGKRTGYLVKCKGLLLEIYYELLQNWDSRRFQPSHYERIVQVQEYIQTNCNKELTLSQLAQLSGFSESHFRRLFHSVTGMSCIQYINLIKIGIAKNLLLSGSGNVSEAAQLTGFSDIYYFSRVFKKVTGHPPSIYKQ